MVATPKGLKKTNTKFPYKYQFPLDHITHYNKGIPGRLKR